MLLTMVTGVLHQWLHPNSSAPLLRAHTLSSSPAACHHMRIAERTHFGMPKTHWRYQKPCFYPLETQNRIAERTQFPPANTLDFPCAHASNIHPMTSCHGTIDMVAAIMYARVKIIPLNARRSQHACYASPHRV